MQTEQQKMRQVLWEGEGKALQLRLLSEQRKMGDWH